MYCCHAVGKFESGGVTGGVVLYGGVSRLVLFGLVCKSQTKSGYASAGKSRAEIVEEGEPCRDGVHCTDVILRLKSVE